MRPRLQSAGASRIAVIASRTAVSWSGQFLWCRCSGLSILRARAKVHVPAKMAGLPYWHARSARMAGCSRIQAPAQRARSRPVLARAGRARPMCLRSRAAPEAGTRDPRALRVRSSKEPTSAGALRSLDALALGALPHIDHAAQRFRCRGAHADTMSSSSPAPGFRCGRIVGHAPTSVAGEVSARRPAARALVCSSFHAR